MAINRVTRDGLLEALYHAVKRAMEDATEDRYSNYSERWYYLLKREGDKINAVLDQIKQFDAFEQQRREMEPPPGPPAPPIPPGPKPRIWKWSR